MRLRIALRTAAADPAASQFAVALPAPGADAGWRPALNACVDRAGYAGEAGRSQRRYRLFPGKADRRGMACHDGRNRCRGAQ